MIHSDTFAEAAVGLGTGADLRAKAKATLARLPANNQRHALAKLKVDRDLFSASAWIAAMIR